LHFTSSDDSSRDRHPPESAAKRELTPTEPPLGTPRQRSALVGEQNKSCFPRGARHAAERALQTIVYTTGQADLGDDDRQHIDRKGGGLAGADCIA